MNIGVPKEIKNNEYRVGLTPENVKELKGLGYTVFIETSAGNGCGATDDDYVKAGATIASSPKEVFEKAELIIKVKEPQPSEIQLINFQHTIFSYLHLAADLSLTKQLIDTGATFIAYETIKDKEGRLPLLAPMSEIAGKLAVQFGARYLESPQQGKGVILSGATGTKKSNVLILGGGVVGTNAARIALGMGANVYVYDTSLRALTILDQLFNYRINTINSLVETKRLLPSIDLVIGAILIPGEKAPKILTDRDIKTMQSGSVIVDVSIDQGGCFETSRPTTHDEPVYKVHNVTHCCITNMPGSVAQTSTYALTNATMPYIKELLKFIENREIDPHDSFYGGRVIADRQSYTQ